MSVEPANVYEYEALARELMPPEQYDFVAGGAADELTIKRARAVFDALLLLPRVLVDTSKICMTTSVLGDNIEMPLLFAPTGFHDRAHPDGEAATAQAAASTGTLMVVAVNGSLPLEETARAAAGAKWFQQGIYRDRQLTAALMERAAAAGYRAICLTLDSPPYPPRRERNIRNKYRQQPSPNFSGASAQLDNGATWSDLERIVRDAPLPIVAKGVMNANDAQRCVDAGVRAVVVSNHGGRNLDTTPAAVEVLAEIAAAVGEHVEVFVDGGVRRGTDVVKALALGARAVLIGRPIFWGLAVDGAAGLQRIVEILRAELVIALAMCGQTDVRAVSRDVVALESPLLSFCAAQRAAGQPTAVREVSADRDR
ncbi:MAG TPA: alpha-hydroxy acid oxidase [Jatrophihabitans sp.]|nr:alpha-hydroxy acid oxidase [Jatrophihabitans sp.]